MVVFNGRVVVTGPEGAGFIMLSVDDGTSIRMEGPLSPEVQRLSGARLSVTGVPSGHPVHTLVVQRYRVLEVNGERPFVGLIARGTGGLVLEREDDVLRLVAETAVRLEDLIGAKVWITGPLDGDGLTVQSFGVIKPSLP